ncbi:serine/threonine protein kinase [Yinghuangia sp. ASG 101]|nr:serine/threonine protein kinase [Yinghuangia sp. ASG 101]
MSRVWSAFDRHRRDMVAVKVPRTDEITRVHLQLLEWEAETASAVRHKNVMRVLGVDTSGTEYTPHLVVELAYGKTLAHIMSFGGAMDPRKVAHAGAQTADALDAVHRAHIAHRDVKPENIMQSEKGDIKLVDFSLAASTRRLGPGARGSLAGTPGYLPPEVAKAHQRGAKAKTLRGPPAPSPAADMYALGLVLHELTTGKHVFDGDLKKGLQAQVDARVPRLSELRDDVPQALDRLVAHLTAKRPRNRPPSAGEVSAELAAIAASPPGRGATSIPVTGVRPHTAQTAHTRQQPASPSRATSDSRPSPPSAGSSPSPERVSAAGLRPASAAPGAGASTGHPSPGPAPQPSARAQRTPRVNSGLRKRLEP